MDKKTLSSVVKTIQDRTGKQMVRDDFLSITDIYNRLASSILEKPFDRVVDEISKIYIKNNVLEYNKSLDKFLVEGNTEDYFRKQIRRPAAYERADKYGAFEDRVGHPLIQDAVDNTLLSKITWSNFLYEMAKNTRTYETVSLPRQTVVLDSINRIQDDSNTIYSWYIHSMSYPIGNIGNQQIMEQIHEAVQMKIQPFWMPARQIPYFRTIRMFVREIVTQAKQTTRFTNFTNTETVLTRYHFEFNIENYQDGRMYLVPKNDKYTFRSPIKMLEKISVEFYNPYDLITLDPDRSNAFTLTAGNPTTLSGPVTNLFSGDLVYIVNFSDPDITLTTTVDQLQGYNVAVINSTTFTISVDTSAAVVPVQNNIEVIYGVKRFSLELEFIAMEQ